VQVDLGMCPSKLLRATACAILLAFTPACSALFVNPLDQSTLPSSSERPRCTSAAAAPALDSIVAVLGVVVATMGIRGMAGEDVYGSHEIGAYALMSGSVLGLTFGASAYGGFSQTTECATVQRKWDEAHGVAAPTSRAQAAYLP